MRRETWQLPHIVYRLHDREGRLLYIGCCAAHRFALRMAEHRANRPWAAEIAPERTTTEPYPGRQDGTRAEQEAILREQPPHNISEKGALRYSTIRAAHGGRNTDPETAQWASRMVALAREMGIPVPPDVPEVPARPRITVTSIDGDPHPLLTIPHHTVW